MPRPGTTALLAFTLVLPILLAAMPHATGQGQVSFTVAIVSARSLGCGQDSEGVPDLRVQARLNGEAFLLTQVATDQDAPVYGMRVDVTAALPARINLLVQEADGPTAAFPSGSVSTCDVAEGEGEWFNHTFVGGGTERVTARGDGPRAAEVVLVVGTDAPATPQAATLGVTTSATTLQWTRAQGPGTPAGVRVAAGGVGMDISLLPADATSARLTGLCDNHAYSVRVMRETGPWILSSGDVAFTTSNAPPLAPRVLRAESDGGNLRVAWESPTQHDVGRYEVHVGGDAGFAPTADTMRGTLAGAGAGVRPDLMAPARAGDAWVIVRTVDTHGLTAVSDAYAIGGAALPATSPAPIDACAQVQVEAPGARLPPSPAPAPVVASTPPPAAATPSPTPAASPSHPAATPTPTVVVPAAVPSEPAATPPVGPTSTGEVATPSVPVPALPLGGWVALAALALAAVATRSLRRG